MRVRIVGAGVMVVLLAVASARAGDLEDAESLRSQGRLEDAATKYRAAAKTDPAGEKAALGLSRTLLELHRYDEAAAAVDAALAKNTASVPLMLAKIRALVDGADAAAARRTVDVAVRPEVVAKSAEARKWVDLLLAKDPKSVPGRILEVRLSRHERGEETADARARLEQVVADAPADADANFQLGMLLFRAAARNNSDKTLWAAAEKPLRAAFAADSSNGLAVLNAARAAAWQGRYDAAYDADLEKAAELLRGDDEPLVAIDRRWAKDATKRIPVFTRLAAKFPDDAGVAFHLAMALNAMGRDEDGLKILEAQREKYPASASVALAVAEFHLAAGKKDAAVEAMLRAAALCKSDADRPVYDRIDSIVVRTTQLSPEQRDTIWAAIAKALPHEVNAPNNAGIWFRDTAGDPAKSLEWFLKALEIAPEDVMLLNDVAIAYQAGASPDVDKSEQFFRRAIATARKNGIDKPERSKGYTLAVDNLVKLLASQKRAKDLLALGKELKDDPRSESILQLAESLRR
jgi:thioredoxin-like negative regulator of GroEL